MHFEQFQSARKYKQKLPACRPSRNFNSASSPIEGDPAQSVDTQRWCVQPAQLITDLGSLGSQWRDSLLLSPTAPEQQIEAADTAVTAIKKRKIDAQATQELNQQHISTLKSVDTSYRTRLSATADSKNSHIECCVCIQNLSTERFPKRSITATCNHASEICLECIHLSIAAQFEDNVWDHIGCPVCNERLQYGDMHIYADPIVFGRYGIGF